jgi:hypothetical protein
MPGGTGLGTDKMVGAAAGRGEGTALTAFLVGDGNAGTGAATSGAAGFGRGAVLAATVAEAVGGCAAGFGGAVGASCGSMSLPGVLERWERTTLRLRLEYTVEITFAKPCFVKNWVCSHR